MKKPTAKLRARQKRKQRYSLRKCRKIAKSARLRARRRGLFNAKHGQRNSDLFQATAPESLIYCSTREDRKIIEDFFSAINDNLSYGKSVTINFQKLQRLYPCGLLILMGWVDHWIKKYPSKVTAKYPKDDLVEQMLQHVKVLENLNLNPRKKIVHNDVKRWYYFSGKNADATPIESFMENLLQILGEERQRGLGSCVTEAMTNVKHHAYDGDNGGPWWMFATIKEGKIFIAIHDRGASIPGTLLNKPKFNDYLTGRRWHLGNGDGELIAAAAGGRTRMISPWRGKGLPEMVEFTRNSPLSEIGIFSRNGFFKLGTEESNGKLKTRITGTLIIWSLKFPESTS